MVSRRKYGIMGWAEFTQDEEKIFHDVGDEGLFCACESAAIHAYCHAKLRNISFDSDEFYELNEEYRRRTCKAISDNLRSFDAPGELCLYVPTIEETRKRMESLFNQQNEV